MLGRVGNESTIELNGCRTDYDAQRYELGAFVVMPNHVHAIVRPFDDDANPLDQDDGQHRYRLGSIRLEP